MNYWLGLIKANDVIDAIYKKFGMDIFPSEAEFYVKVGKWVSKHYPTFDLSTLGFYLTTDSSTGKVLIDKIIALP